MVLRSLQIVPHCFEMILNLLLASQSHGGSLKPDLDDVKSDFDFL
jgi:hypothetical protein